MAAKRKEFITVIKDEEQFLALYNESNKKLMVVDVHPTWCGQCELMLTTYKSLLNQIDDSDKRLEFVSLDMEKAKGLKNDKFIATSRPKFLFILEGKIVDEIQGANVPEFTEKVNKYIPLLAL